jgi:hypothetical protein
MYMQSGTCPSRGRKVEERGHTERAYQNRVWVGSDDVVARARLIPFQRRSSGTSYDDNRTRSTPSWLLTTTGVYATITSTT